MTARREAEKLVTVLTCTFAHEAEIVRGRLESEGVLCFLRDAYTVQMHPFYSNALGGVKLQVRESDVNQAVEIMRESGYFQEKDVRPPKEPPRMDDHTDQQQIAGKGAKVVCPGCGSEDVVKSRKAGWFFLLTSLLALCPSPFLRKTYHCFACKQDFKRKR